MPYTNFQTSSGILPLESLAVEGEILGVLSLARNLQVRTFPFSSGYALRSPSSWRHLGGRQFEMVIIIQFRSKAKLKESVRNKIPRKQSIIHQENAQMKRLRIRIDKRKRAADIREIEEEGP